jgi:hypothetical protein
VTDSRDDFEFLDGDELGEEPGDPDLPGTHDYPPDRALGVDDPSIDTPDDVRTRELRRDVESDDDSPGFVLVAPDAEGGLDEEAQEIGVAVDATGVELSPEESALHVIEPSELDGSGDDVGGG